MLYEFDYYTKEQEQQTKYIHADSDREAVLKLFDEVGICEFGCIRQDGTTFTDNKYKYEKKIIMVGC